MSDPFGNVVGQLLKEADGSIPYNLPEESIYLESVRGLRDELDGIVAGDAGFVIDPLTIDHDALLNFLQTEHYLQSAIVEVGVIATGTWNADVLTEVYGGTGLSSYVLGDTLYSDSANSLAKLSGNITTTKKFLTQTGDGSLSTAPGWNTIVDGDILESSVTQHEAALSIAASQITAGTFGTGSYVIDTNLTSAKLILSTAVSLIVPGVTSLSLRNNADDADNLIITNAGAVTFRSTVGGITTLTATTLAGTLSTAAQTNVTSLGTLTALQVDNININLNTISSTAGTDLFITPLDGQQLILDGTLIIDAGVLTGGSSFTVTTFVGALTGNASTATTLETPRNINGVSFDGSANITVTAAAGTLTGNTLNATVVTSSLTTVGTLGSGAISSGFGNIDIGASTLDCGAISTTGTFTLSSTQPVLDFNETDGPIDEKFWRWTASIGDLYLQTKTDALGAGANVLRVTRTGTTVDLIRAVATTVDVVGALTTTTVDMTGRLAVVAAADSSFTGGGSVGVGTASPQRDLHIEGGVPTIRLSDSNAATDQAVATLIELYRGNQTNRVGFWGMASAGNDVMALATDYAAGEIVFSTGSNVEAVRINSSQAVIFAAGITATTGTFSGNVLIGTTTAATGNPRLDVVTGSRPTLALASNTTNATIKESSVAGRHYTNTEEVLALIIGRAEAAANKVQVGGGQNNFNAATTIEFYTAADTTTLIGTLAANITGVGTASILQLRGDLVVDQDSTFVGTTTFNTITYTWPGGDGGDGDLLTTNGAGTLSWTAGGGGAIGGSGTNGKITKWTAAATIDDSIMTESGGNLITIAGGLSATTILATSTSEFRNDVLVTRADSGTVDMRFQNTTTGAGNNGLLIGLSAAEAAQFWNYENTPMWFGTNNATRLTIAADGVITVAVNLIVSGTMAALDMAGQIDLNTNDIIAGGAAAFTTIDVSSGLVQAAANSATILSGGSSTTLGANLVLYGESHATRADDWEFRMDTTVTMDWDQTAAELTVFGQLIMDDGGLATDVAGVVVSAAEPVAEDYVDGTIWCKV